MKTIYLFIAILLTASCKKDTTITEAIPEGTVIKTAMFVTNAKPTSGTVKVIAGANNTRKLVFENFSTGNGPDVRVWLSPNTTAATYVEVGTLRTTSGTFSYDLDASIDITANNKVLIWCEDVRVLFGSASL